MESKKTDEQEEYQMVDIIQYGFGSQGRWATELILEKKNLNLVGVIDIDEEILGKDVGFILDNDEIGIRVSQAEDVIEEVEADIVTHCTVTSVESFYNQVRPCIEQGMHVITTSEKMSYPWHTHAELSERIHTLAKKHGVSIIGTGVNPGFVPDLLPLTLTGACKTVESIEISRVVDFSEYSMFQPPYMGFGMDPEKFREGVKGGIWTFGRSPLPGRKANIHLLADAMGWEIEEVEIEYDALISKSERETPFDFTILPGQVAGVMQIGTGFENQTKRIIIKSYAVWDPRPEEDGVTPGNTIVVNGEPSHRMTLTGGTVDRGGYVSALRQVNMIPQVVEAEPGLLKVQDLPVVLPLP